MTQGADPYGLQQPAANPDPLAYPGSGQVVGYSAYDPITGQPLTAGYPPAYPPGPPQPGLPVQATPPPVYPMAGQLPPAYPAQYQPGYPVPYPGMQMMPVYAGYPLMPARPARPGGATAAAVLAFVQSGFVLMGGIAMFTGAAAFNDLDTGSFVDSQFVIVAMFTLAAGCLLIAGGATMLSGKSGWLLAGCLASLAVSVYFVILIADVPYASFGLWLPVIYAILPVIALALAWSSDVRSWIRQR